MRCDHLSGLRDRLLSIDPLLRITMVFGGDTHTTGKMDIAGHPVLKGQAWVGGLSDALGSPRKGIGGKET